MSVAVSYDDYSIGGNQVKKALLVGVCVALLAGLVLATPVLASSPGANGKGSAMPTLYDGKQFVIEFVEFHSTSEAKLLAKNKSINIIYQSDQAVNHGFNFESVINAIPGPGFNPVWQEVQIVFKAGVSFVQYPSDDAIVAAAARGDITLVPTTEVYRCPVVGFSLP